MAKKRKGRGTNYHKVEKHEAQTSYTNEYGELPTADDNRQKERGIGVYQTSQLIANIGRTQQGKIQEATLEQPYFYLTIQQRIELCKLCSDVFSIVTSRMNRISTLEFQINPIKKEEDRIAEELKSYYQIYKERIQYTDMQSLTIKSLCFTRIGQYLPDVLPDLSNFQAALMRWKKIIAFKRTDDSQQIIDWIRQPNQGLTWEMYTKKWVFDMLIHGAEATYKEVVNGRLENFDILPGGTVYKFKNKFFSTVNGYVQLIPGEEYQIMFADELSYSEYLSISGQNHSMIPLEALINKLTETLLFDKLMADQADGTKPPEKLVLITNNLDPFGDFDKPREVPLNPDEQKRVEMKLNTPRKFAVMSLTGSNVDVVDLTRENTMSIQVERQRQIREAIGLTFSATNIEMNLTGSESTNGRESGVIQTEISQGRGLGPMLIQLARKMTKDIIAHRFGYGYMMEFPETKDPIQKAQLDLLQLQTGEMTKNEIRERENKSLFVGDEFDKPDTSATKPPDGSISNPFNMKGLPGAQ
jgi:hypothetical protein